MENEILANTNLFELWLGGLGHVCVSGGGGGGLKSAAAVALPYLGADQSAPFVGPLYSSFHLTTHRLSAFLEYCIFARFSRYSALLHRYVCLLLRNFTIISFYSGYF